MHITISEDRKESGRAAARLGSYLIQQAISNNGLASIVVATGLGQVDMYEALLQERGIDWSRVVGFHLDEYIGLPESHPASFCSYLRERLVSKIPMKMFHYIDGNACVKAECERLSDLVRTNPVDVAFIGIGENGHLAFNDPPADFATAEPFIVVQMDEACRRQQVGEGWFGDIAEVPTSAISMSIRQIMASRSIVCTTPDVRKATAVRNALTGPVTPMVPASIIQQHDDASIFLDRPAASLLSVGSLPSARVVTSTFQL